MLGVIRKSQKKKVSSGLLDPVGLAGGEHHLEVVFVGDVQYFDDVLVGHRLVGIQRHVQFGGVVLAEAFAWVCLLPCGSSTLMALGDTIVLVIMKKISSRKMMSVIDDMLKSGLVFVLRLSIS